MKSGSSEDGGGATSQPAPKEVADSMPEDHLDKPSQWATGGDAPTSKQKGFIASLERQAGEDVTAGEGLSKAEASSRIQELKEETGK